MFSHIRQQARRLAILVTLLASALSFGCTHQLRVTNLDEFAIPVVLGGDASRPPRVAITPFSGSPDALVFFNALVNRLNSDPGIGQVRTDFLPALANRPNAFKPDITVSILPRVKYRSSGWNFLINWPGFLIFAPAWHGYVYHADVATTIKLYDHSGRQIDQFNTSLTYHIRHADMDRTIWAGISWLEVSALAFFGGIYNAFSFDRDVISQLQPQISGNYSEWIIASAQKRIRSVAAAVSSDPNSDDPVEAFFIRTDEEP